MESSFQKRRDLKKKRLLFKKTMERLFLKKQTKGETFSNKMGRLKKERFFLKIRMFSEKTRDFFLK